MVSYVMDTFLMLQHALENGLDAYSLETYKEMLNGMVERLDLPYSVVWCACSENCRHYRIIKYREEGTC